MSNADEAESAIQNLDGTSLGGRNIVVNAARERAPRRAANDRW